MVVLIPEVSPDELLYRHLLLDHFEHQSLLSFNFILSLLNLLLQLFVGQVLPLLLVFGGLLSGLVLNVSIVVVIHYVGLLFFDDVHCTEHVQRIVNSPLHIFEVDFDRAEVPVEF